jgi:hypothetical protein
MGMMMEMTPNHAGLGSELGRLRRRRERNERARTTQANASIEHADNIIDTTANLAIIATQQDCAPALIATQQGGAHRLSYVATRSAEARTPPPAPYGEHTRSCH